MRKAGLFLIGMVLIFGFLIFVSAEAEELPDPNAPTSGGVIGCTGTPIQCDELNEMTCGNSETVGQIGCIWDNTNSICSGVADPCENLDEMTCGISVTWGQLGCYPLFGGIAGCNGVVSTSCEDYSVEDCPSNLGCGVEGPLCVEKSCNIFNRRTCGDSDSVGVPGCFWIKEEKPLSSRTFRYASWTCHDGTTKEAGNETVCKRYWSEWILEDAASFCLDHCVEKGPDFNPKLVNYCIRFFSVSEECETNLFKRIMAWFRNLFGGGLN